MELAFPIASKTADTLRVLIVTHGSHEPEMDSTQLGLALSCLRLVYDQPTEVSTCDTGDDGDGLQNAIARLRTGAFDLVITTDITRISRAADEVHHFIDYCVDNGARFISFQDGIDTQDIHLAQWAERRCRLSTLCLPLPMHG